MDDKDYPQTIGNDGIFRQGRNGQHPRTFKVIDAVVIPSKQDKEFCVVAQLLHFQHEKGNTEARAIYYIRSGRGKGWQYCTSAPSFNLETMGKLGDVFTRWAKRK